MRDHQFANGSGIIVSDSTATVTLRATKMIRRMAPTCLAYAFLTEDLLLHLTSDLGSAGSQGWMSITISRSTYVARNGRRKPIIKVRTRLVYKIEDSCFQWH